MIILKYLTTIVNEIELKGCELKTIYLDDEEVSSDLYSVEDDIVTIDDDLLNKEICLELIADKRKIIDYRGDCLYTYNDKNSKTLQASSKYCFDMYIRNKQYENTFEFDTKLSPMYGKPRKVTNLIQPILENLKEYDTNPDIEYELFMASMDVDEYLFDDEDTEVDEDNERYLIKLVEYKAAHNIVYKYYYNLIHEVGTFTKEVGTISETRARKAITASDLLKRFENTIDSLEALLRGEKNVSSFVKASGSSTGLKNRVWDTNE